MDIDLGKLTYGVGTGLRRIIRQLGGFSPFSPPAVPPTRGGFITEYFADTNSGIHSERFPDGNKAHVQTMHGKLSCWNYNYIPLIRPMQNLQNTSREVLLICCHSCIFHIIIVQQCPHTAPSVVFTLCTCSILHIINIHNFPHIA